MKSLFVLVVVIVVLQGCNGSTPVQTVEWYKMHKEERHSMVTKCRANPGELSLSPNCINALQADKELQNSKRGWIKPEPIDFSKKGK